MIFMDYETEGYRLLVVFTSPPNIFYIQTKILRRMAELAHSPFVFLIINYSSCFWLFLNKAL